MLRFVDERAVRLVHAIKFPQSPLSFSLNHARGHDSSLSDNMLMWRLNKIPFLPLLAQDATDAGNAARD